MALLNFWLTRKAELLHLLQQHLVLVLVSTAIAVAIGIPAGIVAAKRPRVGRVILLFANIAQTIPSLALLGFILPLPVIGGIGRVEGPIVGTIVFFLLRQTLADLGTLYLLMLGAVAIVVMLWAPKGLWGLLVERFGFEVFPLERRVVIVDGGARLQVPR